MKPGFFTPGRAIAAIALIGTTAILSSFDQKPTAVRQPDTVKTDTTPNRYKKARDIDDVIDQLNKVDLDVELNQAMKNVKISMEQIDAVKIQQTIDKAMKEVDVDKIQKEVEQSIAKIDWDQIKASIESAKKVDYVNIEKEIKNAQDQVAKMGPQIELQLKNAQVQIDNARKKMTAFKGFLDGLEKDGLISKKEGYTVEYKKGELKINGKKASEETSRKYAEFLKKQEDFYISIEDGEFNMNDSSDNRNDSDEEI